MSRTAIAAPAGLLGFVLYIVVAITVGEALIAAHWAIQAAYYLVAGILWALPARWLILWAGGKR